jgi:hypothetical protein
MTKPLVIEWEEQAYQPPPPKVRSRLLVERQMHDGKCTVRDLATYADLAKALGVPEADLRELAEAGSLAELIARRMRWGAP